MKKLYLKRALAVAGLVLLVFGVEWVARYFVLPLNNMGKLAQAERARSDGEITGLMLGASLACDGLSPALLDEALGGYAFNMGTNAQTMRMSYYALADALALNPDLKQCVIEVSVRRMWRDLDEDEGLSKVSFLEYLRDFGTRMDYFRESFDLDDVPRMVSMSMRCQLKFAVDEPLRRLSPEYFQDYLRQGYALAESDTVEPGERGYVGYKTRVRRGGMGAEAQEPTDARVVYTTDEGAENLYQLRRMVALCRERGVEPVLITIPASASWLLYYQDSYQDAHRYFAQEAEALGVAFYDFNYSKQVRTELNDTFFKDATHMNKYGAEAFSRHLADVLTGKTGADAFYGTFDEAMAADSEVAGLTAKRVQRRVAVTSLQPRGVAPEYRFLVKPQGAPNDQYEVLQDYSPEAGCSIAELKKGRYTLRAEARAVGSEARHEAFSRIDVNVR